MRSQECSFQNERRLFFIKFTDEERNFAQNEWWTTSYINVTKQLLVLFTPSLLPFLNRSLSWMKILRAVTGSSCTKGSCPGKTLLGHRLRHRETWNRLLLGLRRMDHHTHLTFLSRSIRRPLSSRIASNSLAISAEKLVRCYNMFIPFHFLTLSS